MDYNLRIGENNLKGDWKDGEILQHTDLNEREIIIKAAINENYKDIQKILDGTYIVDSAAGIAGATLSKYADEPLANTDDKIPSSLQVKSYVDSAKGEAIAAIPSNVSAFTNDAGYTTNEGTITSVKMNGSTVSTSGEADLGTVITEHQDLSGKQDLLVSGTNIKTVNGNSLLGSGNIEIEGTGGTSNYNNLTNKPKINNVELSGNKSLSDLGAQPAGNYLTTETDPIFSASASAGITSSDITNWNNKSNFSGSYNDLTNKPTIPDSTSDLLNDSGFITNAVNNLLNYYDKTTIDTKVSSVYKYKGSKERYADLPVSGNTVGDVWNIETADSTHGISAGDNVAWTGSAWDKLAGTIDLSGYQTKIDSSHKLSADLIDDTSTTNKLTNATEKTTWNGKQDALVSGTNIKTINSTSLLGSGDISINSGQTIQYDTMPTASASTVGQIVQYVGTTDANYTNGYFYIGTTDGASTPTYSWSALEVQESGGLDENAVKTLIQNAGIIHITTDDILELGTSGTKNFSVLLDKYGDGIYYITKGEQAFSSYSFADGLGSQISLYTNTLLLVFQDKTRIILFTGQFSSTGSPTLGYDTIKFFRLTGKSPNQYTSSGNNLLSNAGTNLFTGLDAIVRNQMLTKNNSASYTVSNNYNPAHKLYVNTTVSDSLTSIAPAYDTTATYAVGDYITYNRRLYVCNTAIATAETWTEAHWTQTTVASILGNINTALDSLVTVNNGGA